MEYIRTTYKIGNTKDLVDLLEQNTESHFVGTIPWGDFIFVVFEKQKPRKYTKKQEKEV